MVDKIEDIKKRFNTKFRKLKKSEKLNIYIFMYVNLYFGETPIYLSKFIYLTKNCDLSEEINIKSALLKKPKINRYKL